MKEIKIYSDDNPATLRESHPFWIWESLQKIPDLLQLCLEKDMDRQIDGIVSAILERKINKIFLLGRGSSYFLTFALRYLLNALTPMQVTFHVSSLFMEYPENTLDEKSAVFILSASGKSEGDLQVVNAARQHKAYTVGVTDMEGSPLAIAVDDVLLGPGGSKRELPATRSYATALFRMNMLIIALGKKLGSKAEAELLESALTNIPVSVQTIMDAYEEQVDSVAAAIENSRAFYVLAHGPNYTNAEEFAMALNQSSGIPSMAYEMENFLHGPMQALTEDETVFLLAPDGILQQRMLQLASAVKIIGAKTVLLAPDNVSKKYDADIIIKMPADIPELISPIVYMIPLWQTAYQLGLSKQFLHPDKLAMNKEEFKEAFAHLMSSDKWVKK